MAFADVIAGWREYGVFEFFLPFLLMFAIFYGLLRKSKLLGGEEDKLVKRLNMIVAGVAALFVMVYTPTGLSLSAFFANFFTRTMVVLSSVLSFALIFYMMIPSDSIKKMWEDPSKYTKFLMLMAGVLVIIVFVASGGLGIFGLDIGTPGMPGAIIFPNIDISSDDVALIVMMMVFLVVAWYITGGGGKKKEKRIVRFKSVPVYEGEE